MSKDKYTSIFSLQMEATVFIILQMFFAARWTKCLRTAYRQKGLLRVMSTFQRSLVQLYEQTSMSLFL